VQAECHPPGGKLEVNRARQQVMQALQGRLLLPEVQVTRVRRQAPMVAPQMAVVAK